MKSKKIIIIASTLFLFTIIPESSNSQSIKFGIKGGLNSSGINGTAYQETKSKTGFNVYVFADFLFNQVLSVSSEAGYSQKGFEYPHDVYNEKLILIGSEVAKAKLDYIDFSMLGKLRIPGKVFVPYVLAGPSFGIKVKDKVSAPHSDGYSDLAFLLMNFENTTFGLKFGVGSELNIIPKISIVLEARYNADLSISYQPPGLTTGNESWTNNSHDLKNHVFEFMAGVKF